MSKKQLINNMREVLELHAHLYRNSRSEKLREGAKDDYEKCASAYNQLLYHHYDVKEFIFPLNIYVYEMERKESK